ncbi:MAG: ABC transporter permease, partial [Proteobacteria bacterium]|nr:ABC transporter permease [Pseudomonadota bacterium]
KNVAPMRVIRRDLGVAPLSRWLSYGAAAAGSLLLLVWYTKDLWLTLWTLLSIVAICLVFGLLAWALLKGGRVAGMQAKSGWRLALAGLQRRRVENTAQILIFGVAIMLLLVLLLIRTALIDEWRSQVPADAANHFVMNIAADEVDGVRQLVREQATEGEFLFPMIRGRVASVNQQSAKDWQQQLPRKPSGPRLTSERSLTWSVLAPQNNDIIAGRWWANDSTAAEVSLEREYAEDFALQLGDTLEFDVGGRRVRATVTSIRALEWESMMPNFYIILSPGALQDFPATYMTSFYLEPTQKIFLNTLLRQYPTITVIEIDALIAQVQQIVAQVSQAVELVLALVLLSGALVLIASIQASRDTRMAEHGLIRALGGTRALIGGSLTAEFLVLGSFAGIVAVCGAELVVAMLQSQVFDLQAEAHPWIWLLGPVAGALIITLVGLAGSRSLIDTPPMNVLRGL